ncbi:hypothetical protein F4561_001037 [Lipingzhangella halophila]|uniref:Uncharacterized protein n=1 Tax=Lipingzhangella halophila TaxID=1783352 RepID=A0A7W7RDX1_9ACTN|nr:hypothetical protein [Lipingzhangella halophila]
MITEIAAREAVRAALAPHEGPGGIRQPGTGLVTTATRP